MDFQKKFPSAFSEKINSLLGEQSGDFFSSLHQAPFLSVRINPFKPTGKFNECATVSWCNEGRYLSHRPSFTKDPLFHAGTYYVQEPSSMFLAEVFKQFNNENPLHVLDLCASPGGKSTLILSGIPSETLLISNETIRTRIPALHENIVKWGTPNVFITNNDARDFSPLKNFFDVIVVDAPCSGEGLFRKDENAISEWSENIVKLCSARQKRILSEVLDSLKEDGILIYSTCTFSKEENEESIKFIVESGNFEPVKIDLKKEWNITETVMLSANKNFFGYRFYPHKAKGEGFFISCLRKKKGLEITRNPKPETPKKLSKEEIKSISKWLKNPGEFEFIHFKHQVHAILKLHFNDYVSLSGKLNFQSVGICLGKIIKGELIPTHDLALSAIISEKIPSVEVDEEQAIKYLRREEIKIIDSQRKGWTLIKYSGFNLGWIKILEGRINNYFPKEYRIRTHD